MPPHTASVTVGPGYPVASYQFPSRDLHDEWFGMVQRARNFCSEKNSLWDEVSEDEMVVFFAEWFGIVERIVRDFGMFPPVSEPDRSSPFRLEVPGSFWPTTQHP